MKKTFGIIFGILLIAAGALFAIEAFGIANINFSFDGWWTLFIIVPSIYGLITSKDKSGNIFGYRNLPAPCRTRNYRLQRTLENYCSAYRNSDGCKNNR